MKTPASTLAAILAALGLAACGAQATGPAARGACTPFATAVAAGAPIAADAAAPVDDCLHRWGYTLAKASDPAEQVAAATVAACSGAISRWNQQALGAPAGPDGSAAPAEPLSLVTGQPTNAFAAHHEFAQGRALFYVVQARAGRCAAPPSPKGGMAPS